MKKILLGAILLFSVISCSTDGVDGINGINGVDGKNGMNGTNGTNGVITDADFRWKALFPSEQKSYTDYDTRAATFIQVNQNVTAFANNVAKTISISFNAPSKKINLNGVSYPVNALEEKNYTDLGVTYRNILIRYYNTDWYRETYVSLSFQNGTLKTFSFTQDTDAYNAFSGQYTFFMNSDTSGKYTYSESQQK